MGSEKKRILIVDDEEMYRWNVADFIEDEGYFVEAVDSGENALKCLREKPFDLVIVDMRLPGMNGNSFILECLKRYPSLRFLIHTGSVEYYLPGELKAAGLSTKQVLYKPLEDMKDLMDAIRQQIETGR